MELKIRKILPVLFMTICMSLALSGQNKNEKLYEAIVNIDTSNVRQLLNNKADPNYIMSKGPWMKVNMLITAVNDGNIYIVKMLIENNANVKWKDGFNTSAILYAAAKGNTEMVELLLNNGADINDNDGQGNTVLSAAKESKNTTLTSFIENKLKEKK